MINVIATLAIAATVAQPLVASYSVTYVGDFGGPYGSVAYRLNNAGQVVGESFTPKTYKYTYGTQTFLGYYFHAFRWDPIAPNSAVGAIHDLGAPSGYRASCAYGINDQGVAVGYSVKVEPNGSGIPTIFNNGKANLLSNSNGVAFDINDAGQIVGEFRGWAVRWDGTNPVVLSDTGISSVAVAISPDGRAAGVWEDDHGVWFAFRTGPNALLNPATDFLGSLPSGTSSVAADINSSGTVVGSIWNGQGSDRGFIFAGTGPMQELPPVPGYYRCRASAINDSGDVVGFSAPLSGDAVPTLWRNGVPTNLNDLLPPGSPQSLNPIDINNAGQILTQDGHLLTPQPIP